MFWRKKTDETVLAPAEPDEAPVADRINKRSVLGRQFLEMGDHDGHHRRMALAALESNIDDIGTIQDDFYRWFSAHQTLKLAVALEEFLVAKALLVQIQDDDIHALALAEHPNLRPLREAL